MGFWQQTLPSIIIKTTISIRVLRQYTVSNVVWICLNNPVQGISVYINIYIHYIGRFRLCDTTVCYYLRGDRGGKRFRFYWVLGIVCHFQEKKSKYIYIYVFIRMMEKTTWSKKQTELVKRNDGWFYSLLNRKLNSNPVVHWAGVTVLFDSAPCNNNNRT